MLSQTWIAALVGNILGFVAGTTLTWSSPALPILEGTGLVDNPLDRIYSEDTQEIKWLGAIMPLGAVFGPMVCGYLGNKIGRKFTIIGISVPFALGYALLAFTKNMPAYLVGRLLQGFSVGGTFTVLPMYLGEVATDDNRGAIGASMNCFICFGLLFSYSVGPYIPWIAFNIILTVIPVVFIVLFFFVALETPQYLLSKEDEAGARETLQKLRGGNVDDEFKAMHQAIKTAGSGSVMDLVRTKGNKKAMIISLGLVTGQQMSGINAVLFFAQTIFSAAGTTLEPEVCSILIGLTQFLTSFVTPLVSDRLGRRILLIFSAFGMVLSEVPLGVFFYMQHQDKSSVANIGVLPIVCLILYIVTYNCGFGPLPWSVMAEIFPSNVKSLASTLTASFCWFVGFLITLFFKSISDAIGKYSAFWIFSACSGLAGLFSIFYVVETKGKNVSEIQAILNR